MTLFIQKNPRPATTTRICADTNAKMAKGIVFTRQAVIFFKELHHVKSSQTKSLC